MERVLLGDLYSWEIKAQVDPLQWVIHLRLVRHWTKKEIPLVRGMLKEWTKVNDCVYRRSQWKRHDFRALIVLKGLGPLQDVNPFLIGEDE